EAPDSSFLFFYFSFLRITTLTPSTEAPHASERESDFTLSSDFTVSVQGYLAHKKQPPPKDHHRAICIGLP
ncbi:hypothetical protein T484DRAFT_1939738, partial [Baffinella frigidus]